MPADDPVIIIGSGLAGYNVAREFRKLNKTAELVIIADDAAEFYSKPMLSNALVKNKMAQDLPMANVEKMRDDLDAKILEHTHINKIDPEKHTVFTSDNESIQYSKLVLALGASAIQLSIQGNAVDKILTVNDLASYATFRESIKDKKKIAIIGAGLIGCEFANDLVLSEYEVSVIGHSELPLNRLLPEQAGEFLKAALAEQGVNWHLGQQAKQINFTESVFKIELENGTSSDDGIKFEVDVVLSAIGLRPNIQIAKEAGIEVNKGIVVNQNLETNKKDIFALGDCAEVAGLFLPYVMPLMNSARALAKNLNGDKAAVTYPAMPVLVKTPSCSVVVAPPANHVEGEWVIKKDEHGVHAQYFDKEGKLQGFALVGKAVEDKQTLTKDLPAVLQ